MSCAAADARSAENVFSKTFDVTYSVEMADSTDGIFDEAVQWVRQNWDPDMTVGQWWERLFEASYSLPSLPVNAYGRGYARADEQAVWRAFAEVGALGPPVGIATMMAAPTIAQHATEAQIEGFVPPILLGRQAWCQLFSEPGAGSDLAGLTTKAVRDGDEWVITGQKVWTSLAREADLGMLLARTDPGAPKHAGITWFAFEMRQSGVEIRPLTEMTGRAMFNEVFIDEATVADDAMIGEPGEGWAVGNTTLMFERASLAGSMVNLPYARSGSGAGELDVRAGDSSSREDGRGGARPRDVSITSWYLDAARSVGRETEVLRDELVKDHITAEVNRLTGQRARTGEVKAIGNLGKLAMSQIARSQREVGNLAIGAAGMLDGADAAAGPGGGDVQRQTISSPAPAIYGGTDQVQRNIIGERVLGLPKEPGPAKTTPFKDLPSN